VLPRHEDEGMPGPTVMGMEDHHPQNPSRQCRYGGQRSIVATKTGAPAAWHRPACASDKKGEAYDTYRQNDKYQVAHQNAQHFHLQEGWEARREGFEKQATTVFGHKYLLKDDNDNDDMKQFEAMHGFGRGGSLMVLFRKYIS